MKAKILTLVLLLSSCSTAWADLVLIVNAKNPIDHLERKQVIDIFMGRSTSFPNQQPVHTLDLINNENIRAVFYKNLTGKNEAQVDAYWATLIFAGRMTPPEKVSSEAAAISFVANNPAAIAYVNVQSLPSTVKVVMELTTTQ